MDFYTNALQETIRRREQSGEKRNDLVQLLIDAKTQELKPEGEEGDVSLDSHEKNSQVKKARKTPMTDKLILSQALLFFFAGFDTMETLLMFAIYELALNQDVQEKLFQEIDKSIEASGGELEYEAVNRMEYLDKVISETLRKYPPAVRTERQCTIDYKFPNSDYELKKGSLVIVPLYGIHYDEEYFPEPERFDPERFSPEVKAKRHPYAYMPFGTGPRSCIAMRFALIEGKAAVARLIHKFKIEPSQKTEIPVKVGRITGFKPDGGMYLNLKRRIEE
jgi:cytochrome P450